MAECKRWPINTRLVELLCMLAIGATAQADAVLSEQCSRGIKFVIRVIA